MKLILGTIVLLLGTPCWSAWWDVYKPPQVAQTAVITGPKGDRGVKGDKGDRGSQGVPGKDGTNGANGQDATARTQAIGESAVRVYDSKYVQVETFYSYNLRELRPSMFGGRVILKVGKSYEEKLIEKLRKEMSEYPKIWTIK